MSGDEVPPESLCIHCARIFPDKGQDNCPNCGHQRSIADIEEGWKILREGGAAVQRFAAAFKRRRIEEKFRAQDSD